MKLTRREQLRLAWLKFKLFYPFQHAHKPLCDRFSEDVIKMRGVYLCRSCALVYTGLTMGIGLATTSALPRNHSLNILLFTALLVGSHSRFYKRWSRRIRDGLRFLLGFCISLGFTLSLKTELIGLCGLSAMFGLWLWMRRDRAQRKLHDCAGCPELTQEGICSGFQLQAQAARLYEERASQVISETWMPSEEMMRKHDGINRQSTPRDQDSITRDDLTL